MRLKDLTGFDNITIQCHDNPDPDAVASAFGLYRYFDKEGKQVRIIYSGNFKITKVNLLLMIKELDIPITYYPADGGKLDGLLVTVDCRYGEGNVSRLSADEVAVIDHHNGKSDLPLSEVHPELGGCSTLIWRMLLAEGYDIEADRALCTALYYGLMTDTGSFAEVYHPFDRDMRDTLVHNESQIRLFSNSNISLEEMKITGEALANYTSIGDRGCGLLRADECDPNILGIISDTALQVDEFKVVIAFGHVSGGYKLSVRSCIREVMADEFARSITEGVGSGGGHSFKAGGFISGNALDAAHPDMSINDYLYKAVEDYFASFELIYSNSYHPDMSGYSVYAKMPMTVGFCDPEEFFDPGQAIMVRTIEGDVDLVVDGSFYIMVGILGEVYPIKKEKFRASYELTDEEFCPESDYIPRVYSKVDGKVHELEGHIKSCRSSGISHIRAKELDRNVKLFTEWDEEKYMRGSAGDYIACREDDAKDFYIIRRDIFFRTYSAVNE